MESGALKRSRRWPLREQTSRKSAEVSSRFGRRVQRPSRWQRKRRKRTTTATITTTRRACNQLHHHHLHRQQQALRLSSDYFPASRAPDQASSHTRGPNVASLARRLDGASSSWILLLLLTYYMRRYRYPSREATCSIIIMLRLKRGVTMVGCRAGPKGETGADRGPKAN